MSCAGGFQAGTEPASGAARERPVGGSSWPAGPRSGAVRPALSLPSWCPAFGQLLSSAVFDSHPPRGMRGHGGVTGNRTLEHESSRAKCQDAAGTSGSNCPSAERPYLTATGAPSLLRLPNVSVRLHVIPVVSPLPTSPHGHLHPTGVPASGSPVPAAAPPGASRTDAGSGTLRGGGGVSPAKRSSVSCSGPAPQRAGPCAGLLLAPLLPVPRAPPPPPAPLRLPRSKRRVFPQGLCSPRPRADTLTCAGTAR